METGEGLTLQWTNLMEVTLLQGRRVNPSQKEGPQGHGGEGRSRAGEHLLGALRSFPPAESGKPASHFRASGGFIRGVGSRTGFRRQGGHGHLESL